MADDFIPLQMPSIEPNEMESRSEKLKNTLTTRRSVRHFSSRPVPASIIRNAVEIASSAPSGAHRQPWHFVVIGDPATKKKIRIAAEEEEYQTYEGGRMTDEWRAALAPIGTDWHKPFLETVPWLIVGFEQIHGLAEDGEKVKNYYVKESVGIACGMLISALHQMGLATLTHTPSPMGFLGDILDRTKNERAFMLFPVGYPAEDATVPNLQRKSLEEVSTWLE